MEGPGLLFGPAFPKGLAFLGVSRAPRFATTLAFGINKAAPPKP